MDTKKVKILEVRDTNEWKVLINDQVFATFRGETARIDAFACADSLIGDNKTKTPTDLSDVILHQ
jgi:hypothetical protein